MVGPSIWPSFVEIGEMACITTAWSSHGHALKASIGFLVRLYAVRYADMSVLLLLNITTINVKFMKCKGQIYTSLKNNNNKLQESVIESCYIQNS